MQGPAADTALDPARLIFVGGLHRSGTTPLARAIANHPAVSGLTGTHVPEDEGQHLQDVYPRIRSFGGMGRFARADGAHLTEESPLATQTNACRLLESWAPFWDLSAAHLLEKSPGNMIMGRFLEALFPGSALVVVVRHPVVSALALAKWNPVIVARNGRRRTTLIGRMENWACAYAAFREDAAARSRVHLLRYEDLVGDPVAELVKVQQLIGLETPIPHESFRRDRSQSYVDQWTGMARGNPVQRRTHRAVVERYGATMAEFGYDPETLTHRAEWWGGETN